MSLSPAHASHTSTMSSSTHATLQSPASTITLNTCSPRDTTVTDTNTSTHPHTPFAPLTPQQEGQIYTPNTPVSNLSSSFSTPLAHSNLSSTNNSPGSTALSMSLPSESVLSSLLISATSDCADSTLESHLLSLLPALPLHVYSPSIIILSVQFLLSCCDSANQHILHLCCHLLQFTGTPFPSLLSLTLTPSYTHTSSTVTLTSDEHHAVLVLKLDIYQRLQLSQRTQHTYSIVQHEWEQSSNQNELFDLLLLLFTTAPVIGKWQDMRRYGALLNERSPGTIEQLHAQYNHSNNQLPNYEILYYMSHSSLTHSLTMGHTDIQWGEFEMEEMLLRMQTVEGEQEEVEKLTGDKVTERVSRRTV